MRAVPQLYNVVTETTKLVQNPLAKSEGDRQGDKVFDTWLMHYPPANDSYNLQQNFPFMEIPSGNSDQA